MTAEDAINVFKDEFCGLEAYCEIHRDGLCLTDGCEVWWAIKALEQYNADVQPVRHGKWVKKWHTGFHKELPCCSVCGHCAAFWWDYCPSCGARMDGEQNDIR